MEAPLEAYFAAAEGTINDQSIIDVMIFLVSKRSPEFYAMFDPDVISSPEALVAQLYELMLDYNAGLTGTPIEVIGKLVSRYDQLHSTSSNTEAIVREFIAYMALTRNETARIMRMHADAEAAALPEDKTSELTPEQLEAFAKQIGQCDDGSSIINIMNWQAGL
jgi:hypothetical protein